MGGWVGGWLIFLPLELHLLLSIYPPTHPSLAMPTYLFASGGSRCPSPRCRRRSRLRRSPPWCLYEWVGGWVGGWVAREHACIHVRRRTKTQTDLSGARYRAGRRRGGRAGAGKGGRAAFRSRTRGCWRKEAAVGLRLFQETRPPPRTGKSASCFCLACVLACPVVVGVGGWVAWRGGQDAAAARFLYLSPTLANEKATDVFFFPPFPLPMRPPTSLNTHQASMPVVIRQRAYEFHEAHAHRLKAPSFALPSLFHQKATQPPAYPFLFPHPLFPLVHFI